MNPFDTDDTLKNYNTEEGFADLCELAKELGVLTDDL